MLVRGEFGRVLAGVALLGHLPASAILNASPAAASLLGDLATGERRAAYLPVRPPDELHEQWTVDPERDLHRAPAPTAIGDGEQASVTGELRFVPDAPGADMLVGVALLDGQATGVAIEASAPGVSVETTERYDSTRSLGHVSLDGAPALL